MFVRVSALALGTALLAPALGGILQELKHDEVELVGKGVEQESRPLLSIERRVNPWDPSNDSDQDDGLDQGDDSSQNDAEEPNGSTSSSETKHGLNLWQWSKGPSTSSSTTSSSSSSTTTTKHGLNLWQWSTGPSTSSSSSSSTTTTTKTTETPNTGEFQEEDGGSPGDNGSDGSDGNGNDYSDPDAESSSYNQNGGSPPDGEWATPAVNLWTWSHGTTSTTSSSPSSTIKSTTTPPIVKSTTTPNVGDTSKSNGHGSSYSSNASPSTTSVHMLSNISAGLSSQSTSAPSTITNPYSNSTYTTRKGGSGASSGQISQGYSGFNGTYRMTNTTTSGGWNTSITKTLPTFNATAPYFDFKNYGSNRTAYEQYLSLHRDNAECEMASSSWQDQYYTQSVWKAPQSDPFVGDDFFSNLFPANTKSLQVIGNTQTANPYYCCCCCSIYWPDVSVAYWPSPQANTQCLPDVGTNLAAFQNAMTKYFNTEDQEAAINTGIISTKPHGPGFDKRSALPQQRGSRMKGRSFHPLSAPPLLARDGDSPVTMVGTDNFTYTSPYVYLEIPELEAADGCGYIGKRYTNVRWSYLPEQISSVWVDDPSCWLAPWDDDRDQFDKCDWQTQAFNFNDLPCPPESLRAAGQYSFIFNPDVAYAPLLAPPPDLHWLDYRWGSQSCTPTFGWDPYIALTPESNLEPATTATHHPESTSARPGPTVPSVPGPTQSDTVHNPPQPSGPPPVPAPGQPTPGDGPEPPAYPTGSPGPPGSPKLSSQPAAPAGAGKSGGAPAPTDGSAPLSGSPQESAEPTQFSPVTTDGHTISFAGDGSPIISGQTLRPGDTATIGGETYVAPAGAAPTGTKSQVVPIVIIGATTYQFAPVSSESTDSSRPVSTEGPTKTSGATPSVTLQPVVTSQEPLWVAIGGHVLTYTLNGVVVDGTTVLPGKTYTIDNTVYSIPEPSTTPAPAGAPASIVIGTSTYSLPQPPVTAPPTAVVIDGATLTEGQAAYISELGGSIEFVSLGTNGELVMGTSTVNVVATPDAHMGGLIWSALGGNPAADAEATVSTGGSERQRVRLATLWMATAGATAWLLF